MTTPVGPALPSHLPPPSSEGPPESWLPAPPAAAPRGPAPAADPARIPPPPGASLLGQGGSRLQAVESSPWQQAHHGMAGVWGCSPPVDHARHSLHCGGRLGCLLGVLSRAARVACGSASHPCPEQCAQQRGRPAAGEPQLASPPRWPAPPATPPAPSAAGWPTPATAPTPSPAGWPTARPASGAGLPRPALG